MKPLRIAFFDFPGAANPSGIKKLLEKKFDVTIDEENPEVIFYSVFGNRHLDFPDKLKIFFTGENVHPDFNLCDYAFGFDWMEFEDRYFRCPNFVLYDEFELLCEEPVWGLEKDNPLSRPRFCNFIYSNANAHPFRDALFKKLCDYKKVDSAGPHLNNTGFNRGSPSLGKDATMDKISFQKECRFSLAVENSSSPGYTTEKLMHALVAGTIPIYWGDPAVSRQFNTRRLINCHEYDDLDQVVEKVIGIDGNPDLAREMLSQPVFTDGQVPDVLTKKAVLAKLAAILMPAPTASIRRNRHVWGRIYENRRKQEIWNSHPLVGKLRTLRRKFMAGKR